MAAAGVFFGTENLVELLGSFLSGASIPMRFRSIYANRIKLDGELFQYFMMNFLGFREKIIDGRFIQAEVIRERRRTNSLEKEYYRLPTHVQYTTAAKGDVLVWSTHLCGNTL